MTLRVVFRTHDGGDRITTPGEPPMRRKVDCTKKELTLTCAYSLSTSIMCCDEDVLTTVLDDNSSDDTIEQLQDMFHVVVVPIEGGFEQGSLAHFQQAKISDEDLVYIIEDDFLHRPEAIQEMIETYVMFLEQVEPEQICLYPDDDYWNYEPPFGPTPTKIVAGKARLWRMNDHTTNTMFTDPQVLRSYWQPFHTLATQCLSVRGINEDTTINLIWKHHVPLFTPLMPLAYHLDHHPLSVELHKKGIAELWGEVRSRM